MLVIRVLTVVWLIMLASHILFPNQHVYAHTYVSPQITERLKSCASFDKKWAKHFMAIWMINT